MNSSDKLYVDHEVRIRMLEEIGKEVKEIKSEMHSHFRWIMGTMISLFGATFLSLGGTVILHIMKLI